jgi:adenylate cyclase
MFSGPLPPIAILTNAAVGWGLAGVTRDPDFAVRRLDTGNEVFPSVGWVAAAVLDAPPTKFPATRPREPWLNYYCRPGALNAVNLDQALDPNGLADGFFRNKIVIVGGRAGEGSLAGARSDEFFTPYSRAHSEPPAPGATIHAFSVLNLLHGDWLTRLGFAQESSLVWIWGFVLAVGLLYFRPWPAIGIALVAAGAFTLLAMYVQVHHRVWFPWLGPAAVQTSVALIWSVGFQYAVAARHREKLRRALAVYTSPHMAKRIANSDFDMSLGGREVEATVMFTDLEGYATLAETLPPAAVSKLLTSYFTETTRAILDRDGTIIKYMGDAVMAVWGAPLAIPQPAQQAVLAALEMRTAKFKEFRGHRLRTRIGINSGTVLSGNLGSEFRFDYTCIGETTNLANRLEGLNKYLGTDILITEATRQELSGIATRCLGKFRPAGKSQATVVFEVLGSMNEFDPLPEWLNAFSRAVDEFQLGKLDESERSFQHVLKLRAGDGPATFYLGEIEIARARGFADRPWDGVVVLDSK